MVPTYPPSPAERNLSFQATGSHASKRMLESVDGRLTPSTRQNAGRLVKVAPAGVVTVPDVTRVVAFTVVLPSDRKAIRSAHATGRERPLSSCARVAVAASSRTHDNASLLIWAPFPDCARAARTADAPRSFCESRTGASSRIARRVGSHLRSWRTFPTARQTSAI